MKHTKKILSKYFQAILDGSKAFEIRKEDDCKYEVGDYIELQETKLVNKLLGFQFVDVEEYTGCITTVQVTYRLSHKDFPQGIMPGYVVLGIKRRRTNEKE